LAVHGVCVLAEHTILRAQIAKDPQDGHRSRYCALRSARGWTLRLAASPQELPLLWTRRLVRTDCRPDMHLDRPPDPASRFKRFAGHALCVALPPSLFELRRGKLRFAGHARRRLSPLSRGSRTFHP
jgi:hypothetical protein